MAPHVEGFKPEKIPSVVSSLLPGSPPVAFCLNTADNPLFGGQSVIYAVKSEDGGTWAVRVPLHTSHFGQNLVSCMLEEEVSTYRRLEQSGFSKSAKLLSYSSSFDNPVGYPYLILSWIDGKTLEWSDSVPPRREDRNKILSQMAEIVVELVFCTQESSRGRTATKCLIDMIDRKVVRVEKGQLPGVQLRDCLVHRALAQHAVHSALDDFPFVVDHNDLSGVNIIVDDDYNVKGLIDWGIAQIRPFQFAIGYPQFMAIQAPCLDPLQALDVNVASSDFLQVSAVRQADRKHYIAYLSSIGISEGEPKDCCNISVTQLAQSISHVLSTTNVDWRTLIFDAAQSKGVHKWMASVKWLLESPRSGSYKIPVISLTKEIDGFLASNIGMRSGLTRDMLITTIRTEEDQ